ncbi:Putative peptidoglycan binding domain-containing protein [Salinihabitans flavidus]|uniref:Putative peptidoglycan binding domain-containing protein n=1 Tax=Salinihabitans flavidus TaxID=569882 RepID=A0A1H8LAT1_9RHOB|nr:serine protease [Salinihabitans flavidus]SEO02221.1 Putative peptidoglycan binding domain-containing protein [Salinihabitans flavidus]
MMRVVSALILFLFFGLRAAIAQQDDTAFVQIEAHPSLNETQNRIQIYARSLEDVNGFSLGTGWYAIALGPYRQSDAEQVLRVLRAEGRIPRDAFIAFPSAFRQQIWPVGADSLDSTRPARDITQSDPAETEEPGLPMTPPEPPDETPREARANERLLSAEERMDLQRWLKWAGHYTAAIDGAFGRGTRASMAEWQRDNGYEATGVLTTRQRRELRQQYNAVLDGLGLQTVTDREAGISVDLPLGVLEKEGAEFPFVRYNPSGDIDARALLISQAGDQNTLFGLYDIMQTLKIVPLDGPRERDSDSFQLIGENDTHVSHTEVSLEDGEIKGFTLYWPAGDEERRSRLLSEMQRSFTRLDGTLDPAAGSNAEQSIDLVAGLELRRPKLSRSGFFINDSGTVVTTAEVTEGCSRITLDTDHEARVVRSDPELGVAVLRPTEPLAPMSVASFRIEEPRLKSEIAVAGFSFEGALNAPSVTFGELADIRGLNGEANLRRLALASLPGDVGGPVFDTGGTVLGMLLPKPSAADRQLPDEVSFAAASDAIRAILSEAGIRVEAGERNGAMAPEDLTTLAGGITVLVSCWD